MDNLGKLRLCVPCHFGLESVLAFEIRKLGGEELEISDGRISFTGDEVTLAKANLHIASGERVLIELGSFQARSFEELFNGVEALELERFIGREDAFPVKGYSLKSKLHSVPDCQRIVKKACVKRMGRIYGIEHFEETGPRHQIQFSILKDKVSVYLDTSGVGLHKRGYRRNSNEAPIKETLAAGIIDLARVRSGSVVVDPMCGSGTLLIEAAYKGLSIAPGLRRSFSAMDWSQVSRNAWETARAEALDMIDRSAGFKAFGFDIDDMAVELTWGNSAKAGVGSRITAKQQDIGRFDHQPGTITVCNPPYGERMLELREAEELYKRMGQRLAPDKDRPCFIISPHEEFEKFFGKRADKKRKLYNGMIKCDLYMYFR